jgi:hypothetical protein
MKKPSLDDNSADGALARRWQNRGDPAALMRGLDPVGPWM